MVYWAGSFGCLFAKLTQGRVTWDEINSIE